MCSASPINAQTLRQEKVEGRTTVVPDQMGMTGALGTMWGSWQESGQVREPRSHVGHY